MVSELEFCGKCGRYCGMHSLLCKNKQLDHEFVPVVLKSEYDTLKVTLAQELAHLDALSGDFEQIKAERDKLKTEVLAFLENQPESLFEHCSFKRLRELVGK